MKSVSTDYKGNKFILITYNSSKLKNKDKVRFYYALKGRDGVSGVLKMYNAEFLGKGVLLVPSKSRKDIIIFLNGWKLSYTLRDISIEAGEEVINDED